MLLGSLLAQYEEELIAVGEEAESLSFAYRALKNWTFTDFVLALQKEVEVEDQALLLSIFEQLKHHPCPIYYWERRILWSYFYSG